MLVSVQAGWQLSVCVCVCCTSLCHVRRSERRTFAERLEHNYATAHCLHDEPATTQSTATC